MMSRWLGAAALVVLLGGCATPNKYDDLEMKSVSDVASDAQPEARLGIAFGGGGVRGFMHLGVIKALEEEGIKADVVTGTSAGSIAATLYASGMTYEEIEHKAKAVEASEVADLVMSGYGVINGRKLSKWVNDAVPQQDLAQMTIPVGVTATNMSSQQLVVFTSGNPGESVQASCSIPGTFVPVHANEELLVDGGVLSMVPVDSAHALGAQVVIGVDIFCANQPKQAKEKAIESLYAVQRLQSCIISEPELQRADVLIRPEFEPESDVSFESRDAAIEAGYQATKAVIPQIKKLLGEV